MIAHTAPIEPPAEANPQEHFAALRTWITEHCHDENPVRQAAQGMADSAIVHRLLKFGPDETLNTCSARDLMRLLVFTNGLCAEYLMRVAYIRSIIEGDHAIYEHFNTTLFLPDLRAWYWQLVEALMGQAPNPQMVTTWLENAKGEELGVARLIIARLYPDLALLIWLDDVPTETPRLAAELARVIAQDKRKHAALKAYLREHPAVKYSLPDGALP